MEHYPPMPGPYLDGSTVEREIMALSPTMRTTMAALALKGYRFKRGKFYWNVVSAPYQGKVETVDSLEPDLRRAVAMAVNHMERRANGQQHQD
jgi:hypothetical protein